MEVEVKWVVSLLLFSVMLIVIVQIVIYVKIRLFIKTEVTSIILQSTPYRLLRSKIMVNNWSTIEVNSEFIAVTLEERSGVPKTVLYAAVATDAIHPKSGNIRNRLRIVITKPWPGYPSSPMPSDWFNDSSGNPKVDHLLKVFWYWPEHFVNGKLVSLLADSETRRFSDKAFVSSGKKFEGTDFVKVAAIDLPVTHIVGADELSTAYNVKITGGSVPVSTTIPSGKGGVKVARNASTFSIKCQLLASTSNQRGSDWRSISLSLATQDVKPYNIKTMAFEVVDPTEHIEGEVYQCRLDMMCPDLVQVAEVGECALQDYCDNHHISKAEVMSISAAAMTGLHGAIDESQNLTVFPSARNSRLLVEMMDP
jgi:hypothetical protein